LASVLLPIHNADKYLVMAIESVLTQDYRNFELLLLNDGSTDGSAAILERFAALDARCKVHAWPNRGLIATLNAGIQLAAGKVLIRMDADDICRPHRFSRQMSYMQEHPDCVAVGSRVMLIDAEGWPICEFLWNHMHHDDIDAAHIAGMGGSSIVHPSAVIRRQAIMEIGGYRAAYPHAEDLDLFLRLAEVGKLANLAEVLLEYRQHPDSVGYLHACTQWDSVRRAVVDACARRGLRQVEWTTQLNSMQCVPSSADMHRKWSWWALGAGNRKTASKHAWKALSCAPFDMQNLRLCACVLRGH
jgi:glycosyltransferase involved in cell wall biosynthesis